MVNNIWVFISKFHRSREGRGAILLYRLYIRNVSLSPKAQGNYRYIPNKENVLPNPKWRNEKYCYNLRYGGPREWFRLKSQLNDSLRTHFFSMNWFGIRFLAKYVRRIVNPFEFIASLQWMTEIALLNDHANTQLLYYLGYFNVFGLIWHVSW
jgi:hypothetical protein